MLSFETSKLTVDLDMVLKATFELLGGELADGLLVDLLTCRLLG